MVVRYEIGYMKDEIGYMRYDIEERFQHTMII